MTVRRNVKDSLFRYLFANEKKKENTLSLYNALNNTSYSDPDELTLITIEDAVYVKWKNDLAFIVKNELNIYEHQSTINGNMPIRCLLYLSMIVQKYVNEQNIYGTKTVKLPNPNFVILYNGSGNTDDYVEQRLSDSYENGSGKNNADLLVKMYNINKGRNRQIVSRSPQLKDYSSLVSDTREYSVTHQTEEAFEMALNNLPSDSKVRKMIEEDMENVIANFLNELQDEKYIEIMLRERRKEAREEGLAEGKAKGLAEGKAQERKRIIEDMIHKFEDDSIIAKAFDMSVEEVRELREALE